MKQTAVKWLYKLSKKRELDKFDLQQANAMEKEQIEDAYDAGLFDGSMDDVKDRIHKQYYNETYGGKK
jgi:hypothetical protein